MGVLVTILVHLPEFWVFIAALCVSCAVLVVFLWRMETELKKESAPTKKKKSGSTADGASTLLAEMGYDYETQQGILVSRQDAWQRQYGYCKLYDEAAALCGIIIHCEPIAFEFEGKRWLLELWKGQYNIACGAEIGLYYTDGPDVSIPGVFTGPFYECVPDEERPRIMMTLFRRGGTLLTLEERHWWLAGHKLGLYTRPEDLVLRGSVSFKSAEMAEAAYNALYITGYTPWEIGRVDETVYITFARPHTAQPRTQKGLFARITRLRLRWEAHLFRRAVKDLSGMDEILAHLRERSPMLYAILQSSARSRDVLTAHGTLRDLGKK